MPKPSRHHVNTAGAMKQLMNAMNRNISRSNRFARQQAIQNALENYSKAKQEKAEAYASYKVANQVVAQNNRDIDMEVKTNNYKQNMARLQDESREEQERRRINRYRS